MLDERHAHDLDANDELPTLRGLFHVPPDTSGNYDEVAYFAGNSLGLQPRSVEGRVLGELREWAELGVEGHFEGGRPWTSYASLLREPSARLIGALTDETVVMNSLTVNLHLMMVSFYRPTPERYAILIEDSAFPSDSYAVRSQAAWHGDDPDDAVIRLKPRPGEAGLRSEDVVEYLRTWGSTIALVLLGGVNYYSGELLDIENITRAGHDAGAAVGWDLAHAAGNVELRLHDWNVDWAAWCTYKYLNSGPGSVAGAFVHQRHLADRSLPKFSGWWSTNADTRFLMAPTLDVVDTADSWQLSCTTVLSLAPVLASLEIFDAVGLPALRSKSRRLTGFLEQLLDEVGPGRPFEVITPRDPERRGAQLSLRLGLGLSATEVSARLRAEYGVIADARQPDVVRLAPVPLYSTFHDCWRAATAVAQVVDAQ